jgi:hypothetical protein
LAPNVPQVGTPSSATSTRNEDSISCWRRSGDARELAEAIGAETIGRYPGYASQRGVKYGSKFQKTLKAAIKRGKTGKRLQEDPANKST